MTSGQHIIVTGGAGFIGSQIARRLLSEGCRVTILDNLSTGTKTNIPPQADFIQIDLGQKEMFDALNHLTADAVFHLAGQSSGEASFLNPLGDLESHVMSTFWLLDWCKAKGIARFLYASSMSVYGDPPTLPLKESHPVQPKTFYGAGKAAAESYIKLYQTLGINTTIFRLFSVYGPGQNLANKMQGMVSIYLSYMLEGKPVLVKGARDRFRDLVFIDDVVDAWMTAYENPKSFGKLYNVAGGRKFTVEEILNGLKKSFKNEHYPIEFKGSTPGDQFGVIADVSLIEKDLGWRPKVSLEEGLERMVSSEMQGKVA